VAIKAVSSQRGYDIRDFTLVAFGGAGPMHAGKIALDLGIPSLLIPYTPGVTSALGLLMSDVKHDYVRSKLALFDELELDEVNDIFSQLTRQAKADLEREGFRGKEIALQAFLDIRYAGQGYELTVPSPNPPLKPVGLELMRQRFHEQHELAHGHKAESEPLELVSLRLVSIGLVAQAKLRPAKATGRKLEKAKIGERSIFFGKEAGRLKCLVYSRDLLEPKHRLAGPAVIEQMDTTTLIHPEQEATVDSYRNLIIKFKSGTRKKPSKKRVSVKSKRARKK
jgi:N-methylhydantoinase A